MSASFYIFFSRKKVLPHDAARLQFNTAERILGALLAAGEAGEAGGGGGGNGRGVVGGVGVRK